MKLPIIAIVVFCLVTFQDRLQGFMALFCMVGVASGYEARHSLWTIGRQIPVMMMTIIPLIVVGQFTQPWEESGLSLAIGLSAFMMVLLPVARHMRPDQEKVTPALVTIMLDRDATWLR